MASTTLAADFPCGTEQFSMSQNTAESRNVRMRGDCHSLLQLKNFSTERHSPPKHLGTKSVLIKDYIVLNTNTVLILA